MRHQVNKRALELLTLALLLLPILLVSTIQEKKPGPKEKNNGEL